MGSLIPTSGSASSGTLRQLGVTLEMIQFEHTVFALPFALMGAVLAKGGIPAGRTLLWILLAMVSARSAAMTFNRLADQVYDAKNPRTSSRPLVTRRLSRGFAWSFLVCNGALFVFSAAMLNQLAFLLSFPVLVLILGYSFTKRFTWGAHFLLGASLGCAPLGAWIAVRGSFNTPPLVLGLAVLCWTAGFDVIYACQDIDFDRREGLHSIPRRWGLARALLFARLLHLLMLSALVAVGCLLSLGYLYYVGVGVTGLLLGYEHSLVRADDLSRVNRAFFTVNGCISILLFAMTLADRLSSG
jgi:4-hydroxybenzoate polyprenyltransferase